MKAFLRGNKLVLSRRLEHRELSATVALVAREMERLKSACEDRGTEAFPVDTVRQMVELGNTLRGMGTDIDVPEHYLQAVTRDRDPCGYFESVIRKADDDRRLYERTVGCLAMFAEMLSEEGAGVVD